jgi:hypothetical protein
LDADSVKLFTCLFEESINSKTKEEEKKPAATNDSNASNIIFGYASATHYTCDEL